MIRRIRDFCSSFGWTTILALLACGVPAARCVAAPVIVGLQQGKTGGTPPNSSPGDAFSFDFRSITGGLLPLNLSSVKVTFFTSANPTTLRLQLSTGDLFSIAMISPGQTIFEWYTPGDIDPAQISWPHAVLPQSWWNEVSGDGIVSGHLWMEGATRSSSSYSLTVRVNAWNVPLPEPACSPLAILGTLLVGRRRPGSR